MCMRRKWKPTVDEFVDFVSACGPSPLLEEMRADWVVRETTKGYPYRLRWSEWLFQFDTFRNAKRSGTIDLL
jgi:hypothetical protein